MNENEKFTPPETERKVITFDDFIDHERVVPADYQELILLQEQKSSKHDARFMDTRYSANWNVVWNTKGEYAKFAEQELQYFKDHLQGQTLVDLGGGYGGEMLNLAANLTEAQMYINVDRGRFHPDKPPNPLEPTDITPSQDQSRFLVRVKADMLDFISRMKDGSANFAINGIDPTIVGDPRYNEALAKELVRATRPGGLIFGIESEALFILRDQIKKGEINLREHIVPEEISTMMREHIFEKPE